MLAALFRLVANTFFRNIEVIGAENIPAAGPVIFAGNHPNAMMDGFVLISTCGRWPLHFLANAKLWKYKLLVPMLRASGAVAVFRREEHEGEVNNQDAFEALYDILASGHSAAIFPEGISHVESQLVKLKTGTARIALNAMSRGRADVRIVPFGLNYINRHRFRSQVLVHFGEAIAMDEKWRDAYQSDNEGAVRKLTEDLVEALTRVTLNGPNWRTLRFVQAARRLYKPSSVELELGQYVELSRRFVDGYLQAKSDPELQSFRDQVEDYQARLDMFGLKDHQLRRPMTLSSAIRKVFLRTLAMLALLPLVIPAAILHLPIAWIAATVAERFAYEEDDIATLKVFATILMLPLVYAGIAISVGMYLGLAWGLLALAVLVGIFFLSLRLIEVEAGLLISVLSIIRLSRLGSEAKSLRQTRDDLVKQVRSLANRFADPEVPRLFTDQDFRSR